MAVKTKTLIILLIAILGSGCSVIQNPEITKIALLAPFEGRYREVGYNALYAARLALTDLAADSIHLLAVDDGGSIEQATRHAKALSQDPSVKVVLAIGPYATTSATQQALDNLPMVIIGYWGTELLEDQVFMLANPTIVDHLTIPASTDIITSATQNSPLVGGVIFALEQYTKLTSTLDGVQIVSSGSLPDDTFRERYLNSDLYVPEPDLLATLTYDATGLAITSVREGVPLDALRYDSINGTIAFENGYWANAPIHIYQYDRNGRLALAAEQP